MATKNTAPAADNSNEVTPYTLTVVSAENMKEVAQAIWAAVPGENFQERHDTLQGLFAAIREARDANKSSRPRKETAEIIAEALNRPMGELQAVKVSLGGITLSIPQIVKLAQSEDSPMKGVANDFLKENKLKIVKKKVSSKGKESTFLEKAA